MAELTPCSLWAGAFDSHGYGVVGKRGNRHKAHRVAYAVAHGLDVRTMGGVVMHSCDTPACVNPEHLVLGTQAENMADMVAKGRHNHGESQNGAVLTESNVREIRQAYRFRDPLRGGRALAQQYGVTPQTICDIVKGRSWQNLN